MAERANELVAGNKKIPLKHTYAPADARISEGNIRKVAFQTFKGDSNNTRFTSKLTAQVAGLRYNGANCYTIIERENLPVVLQEMENWESELFKLPQDQRMGLLETVDTLVVGTVTMPKTERTAFKEERSRCVRKDKDDKCVEYQKYYVNCSKKTASFEFTTEAISVTSAQVAYAKTFSGSNESKHCADSQVPEASDFEVESAAQQNAFLKMRHDIAPYLVTETPRIRTNYDADLTKQKTALEHFKKARKYVGEERLDRACEAFQKAVAAYDQSPNLNYNMALCAEHQGDYESAVSFYDKADRLYEDQNDKSDDEIVARLKQAKAMVAQKPLLANVCRLQVSQTH
jgi:tetratricopeptide (TPR) repeat protein